MRLTALTALTLVAATPAAPAQPPDSPAYRHFLNSPYGVRTYSGLWAGRVTRQATPFGAAENYVEPGWIKHRIGPWGFEADEYAPGFGGRSVGPWGAAGYSVPGTGRRYAVPAAPPALPPPVARAPLPAEPGWYWDGRDWQFRR